MSKKNNLKILDDAVVRIQRVIENDDGENPLFSQVMAEYENKWLKEFHNEATKSPTPGRKAIAKPGSPANQPLKSKAENIQKANANQ